MAENRAADYEQIWDVVEYLAQYYSSSTLAEDERANFAFLSSRLRAQGRTFETALEFGCGPTIHHAASLVPFARKIELADYMPSNLDQVRSWLAGDSTAHNWDVYLTGMLAVEGDTGSAALEARKELLRRRVTGLRTGDIRNAQPLGDGRTYDLVASYYCVEAVTADRARWAELLGHLCSLIAPGGTLILGVMRRCREYHVLDRSFPTATIDESDLTSELARFGFQPSAIEVVVSKDVGWADQGFDSICCVHAIKDHQAVSTEK